MGSYSEAFHFIPIPADASPDNSTDEDDKDDVASSSKENVFRKEYDRMGDNSEKFILDNANFEQKEKELFDIFNTNSAFSFNNPNFEIGCYNEAFHCTPIPTIVPPNNNAKCE
ncbi:hypothetical protein TNCV_2775761 [Trichonephila clavipes]|nr:hypothetical protein TNCV_2775761 [Trichonephila clavipes]